MSAFGVESAGALLRGTLFGGASSPLAQADSSLSVQLASDLHIEFFPTAEDAFAACFAAASPLVTSPTLVLAGDIGTCTPSGAPKLEAFLSLCLDRWAHVWLLAGNHEYYGVSVDAAITSIEAMAARLNARHPRVQAEPGLTFFNRTHLVRGRFRVVGATLWSHVPVHAAHAVSAGLNDYHHISVARVVAEGEEAAASPGRRRAAVEDTNAWHAVDAAFIAQELAAAAAAGQTALVLTHHAPYTKGTSAPEHEDSPISSAFATDLSHLFRGAPARLPAHTWLSGHTHFSADFVHMGTRLVSNQRGYNCERRVVERFDAGKVVTVTLL